MAGRTWSRPTCKVDPDHETFHIWVFYDPAYQDPLVLATNVALKPESVFALYLDRWPVEQVPLAAKQMIGLQRQFVFAPKAVCDFRNWHSLLATSSLISLLSCRLCPLVSGINTQKNTRPPAQGLGEHRFSLFPRRTWPTSQKELPHLPLTQGH